MLHQILPLADLHLPPPLALFPLSRPAARPRSRLLEASIRVARESHGCSVDGSTYDFRALRFGGFDDLLDDFAVWLSGQRARAPFPSRARGPAYSVQVDGAVLRGCVVNHRAYGGDIEASARDVGRE